MAIAIALQDYLDREGVEYELLEHPFCRGGSMRTAESARISGEQLAKCVVFEDAQGEYLMVVLPATRQVDLDSLQSKLTRQLALVSQHDLGLLFYDCETGALPPLGWAYGVEVLFDESLAAARDIYFEAGDHAELVHVKGTELQTLMTSAHHGDFSREWTVSAPG